MVWRSTQLPIDLDVVVCHTAAEKTAPRRPRGSEPIDFADTPIASSISDSSSQMNPVTPCSTTSGTLP